VYVLGIQGEAGYVIESALGAEVEFSTTLLACSDGGHNVLVRISLRKGHITSSNVKLSKSGLKAMKKPKSCKRLKYEFDKNSHVGDDFIGRHFTQHSGVFVIQLANNQKSNMMCPATQGFSKMR